MKLKKSFYGNLAVGKHKLQSNGSLIGEPVQENSVNLSTDKLWKWCHVVVEILTPGHLP
jgi:hypothetical protein